MNRTKKILATIELPILPCGNKAFRCDTDPNHFQKMSELQNQYPNAEIDGNVHQGYTFFKWVYEVAEEPTTSNDDQSLEPIVYLTGNTPVTATETMMSELHEADQDKELARELLDFAAYLGDENYDKNTGMKVMKRISGGYNLTASEVCRYTDIAINVRSFMDAHDGGHYSTL